MKPNDNYKDYKVEYSVYITKSILEMVYNEFSISHPQHIKEEVESLLQVLIQEVEKDYDFDKDEEVLDFEIIERVILKEKNETM